MAPNPILDIPGFLVCPPSAHRVQSGALPGFAIVLVVRRVVHVTHKAVRQAAGRKMAGRKMARKTPEYIAALPICHQQFAERIRTAIPILLTFGPGSPPSAAPPPRPACGTDWVQGRALADLGPNSWPMAARRPVSVSPRLPVSVSSPSKADWVQGGALPEPCEHRSPMTVDNRSLFDLPILPPTILILISFIELTSVPAFGFGV